MFSLISERKLGDRRRSFGVEKVYLVVNSGLVRGVVPGPHHQTVGAPFRVTHSQALQRSLQTECWWAGLAGPVSITVESLG